jgi:hypothetical protein
MKHRYFGGEDNGVLGDEANRTRPFFDSFNGVLHLEEMAVGGEDGDG